MVEGINKQYPKKPGFPLWDFSGYNTVNMEEVPSLEKPNGSMDWYSDVAHFKKSLGNMIQDRVFGYTDKERDVPIDFGVQINSRNIDLYHRTQRNKQIQYTLAHQEEIKELAG